MLCFLQRQQEYEANVFARMFKQAIAPKQLKMGRPSKVKGGFATQRAYGIDASKSPQGKRSKSVKEDRPTKEERSTSQKKRPALSGLLSMLDKD